MLAKLFRSRRGAFPTPMIPPGERVYAVGDVHGRLDLLDQLLARIDADDAEREDARVTLIFLGDLVDRGPDSAGVIDRLRELATPGARIRFIKGNHEEIFLAATDGDDKALRLFCRIGGRETAASYGINDAMFESADYAELAAMLDAHVPAEHRAFLDGFEDLIEIGDYAFVHAGIDPATPLAEQSPRHLRWIRDRFLDHKGALEKVVVHGHTVADEAEFRDHRIGIDTGAYATGRLTALGLEGDRRWLVQTEGDA